MQNPKSQPKKSNVIHMLTPQNAVAVGELLFTDPDAIIYDTDGKKLRSLTPTERLALARYL